MRALTLTLVLSALAVGACAQHGAQATSGKAYLSRYQPVATAAQPVTDRITRRTDKGTETVELEIQTVSTDDLIRRAADIEPLLNLPARIGLARIEGGELSTIPNGETALWSAMAARHRALGSFAAIDPFVANYTIQTVLPQDQRTLRRDANDIITKIRLGAARQHMDAVLIYEIGARTWYREEFANLPLVQVLGNAPYPAKPMEFEGVARAFLMDVRNGYPYGVASASTDLKPLERDYFDDSPADPLHVQAKTKITATLMPQVEAMLEDLSQAMQVRVASAN